MPALSEWVSATIGWPVVGWWIAGFMVAVVAYEVTGEVQRKRRIARREGGSHIPGCRSRSWNRCKPGSRR